MATYFIPSGPSAEIREKVIRILLTPDESVNMQRLAELQKFQPLLNESQREAVTRALQFVSGELSGYAGASGEEKIRSDNGNR